MLPAAEPHAIYKILHYITCRHRHRHRRCCPRSQANEFCHCICFRIRLCALMRVWGSVGVCMAHMTYAQFSVMARLLKLPVASCCLSAFQLCSLGAKAQAVAVAAIRRTKLYPQHQTGNSGGRTLFYWLRFGSFIAFHTAYS